MVGVVYSMLAKVEGGVRWGGAKGEGDGSILLRSKYLQPNISTKMSIFGIFSHFR
jgi:hypothetical protein